VKQQGNGDTDRVAHPAATREISPLNALVGPGRSGTTWAGTLLDSSPEIIYRFEPFHRMARLEPEFHQWFERLKKQVVREVDVPRLYALLRKAHPLINKPPFFPEKTYRQRKFGRTQVWPLARVSGIAQSIYGAAYSPPAGPPLIFKEVTFLKPVRNLLERTSVPLVYIVRHPCATVLSEVSGQSKGRMPSWRQLHLEDVLREHAPELAERFPHVLSGSDIVQRTALLWRCEIESCVPLVRQSTRGMVLTYEQLADDAYTYSKQLFTHFGLQYSEQTEKYIDLLYELDTASQKRPRRTGWGDKYFSVYRNPRVSKDAWKTRISSNDRRKIESIIEDSAAVSFCAALGGW